MEKIKKGKKAAVHGIPNDFGHEIWGLIFLAIGLLVLISIVAHLISPHNNILGYYFGTAFSTGLIFLLGPIAVFSFPLVLGILGWQRFRGEPLDVRMLFYVLILTVELCLILAIRHLPHLAAGLSVKATNNYLGFFFIQLVEPLFDRHTFGPYFITSIALPSSMARTKTWERRPSFHVSQ